MQRIGLAGLCATLLFVVNPAWAGIYADDMGRCLVKAAGPTDRLNLVVWIFAAISRNPAVQSYTTFTDEQRHAADATFSGLVVRLITADCRTEAVTALKYEGPSVLESSFSTLGQVAARDLMTDPHVTEAMRSLGSDAENDKMKELMREAGLSVAP